MMFLHANMIIIKAVKDTKMLPQLIKQQKTNFHAGTRNGMPMKRRK